MSKSFRRHKKSSRLRFKSRKGKLRFRTRKLRGGNGEKVECSMCGKMVSIEDTFVPRECLMKHFKGAHRICQNCWWNRDTGFALESSSHKCPGCQKGLPLTPYIKEEPIFIDLTED